MCETCGCGQPGDSPVIRRPSESNEEPLVHSHPHTHPHGAHDHDHDHGEDGHHHDHPVTIPVERDILARNNLLAERNRGYLEARSILALNLVSSPGSGKTSLLERTITDLKGKMKFFVIEGDQQTMADANRIDKTGTPVVQINTGNGCHLDANMVNLAMKKLDIAPGSVLFIENVGNLVCPALFDLGEAARVVIVSVTEGEDKPLKYPNMFRTSRVCIINKTDLLPHVDFDMNKVKEYARHINHHLEFFEVSVKTGEGMEAWYNWLEKQVK